MKIQTIRERLLATTMIGGVAMAAAVALPVASVVLAPTSVAAQDFTSGALQGTVQNVSGQPIAGATVVVSQNERAFSRTATTNSNGGFRISGAPVGRYTVTISAPGIETYTDTGVAIGLGSAADYTFTVGQAGAVAGVSSVDDIVVVGSRRATLDFDRTTTGITLDVQETFDRLPTARNLTAIQLLAPQTTPGDSAFGNEVSIAGSSVAENVYYLNGMNITNFRTFLGGNTVPFEFYQQVDVKTGGFQAEFGRSTGGAVVAVSRSGSNEFHGGANVYYNPNSLRETVPNTTFNQLNGTTTVSGNNDLDEREQLEGNVWLSGPVVRDHIYFFGFYNARDFSQSDTSGSGTRTTTTFNDPFYGGKLDFYLNPDHRLELTYFKDDQSNETQELLAGASTPSQTFNETGGETKIAQYTGNLTDWLTISALYGEGSFNQSTIGSADGEASVVGFAGQGTLRGNPAQLIETGIDERKLMRFDADVYVDNFFGNHHIRMGVDREDLTTSSVSSFSGGIQYVYRGPATGTQVGGAVPANTPYVRVRNIQRGGSFDIEQTAFYIQDAWDVNDRLSLQLGLRAEKFDNKNIDGDTFAATDFDLSPRIGAAYDLFGDKSTRLSAFYGRYYIPIAGNTNLRLAGAELFTDDYYLYNSVGGLTLNPGETQAQLILRCAADRSNACAPGLAGAPFLEIVNSNGLASDPASLVSQNLEAQYQDEFIVGISHDMDNGWRFSANATYRKLGAAMEDYDTSFIIGNYCASVGIAAADCGAINNAGEYVLLNPGSDLVITPDPTSFPALAGQTITIPASILDIPEAKRTYQALELSFERPWDGRWALQGSVVLAKSEGNIEGGVKSDNGQTDTGLTQDFDEPGWTDGSFGLLPNHRGQTFKLFGSYALTDSVTVGGNLFIQSPRAYGCIGSYPLGDGRAVPSTITANYCVRPGGSVLTPRGSQFDGQWTKRFDMSIAWDVPVAIPGSVQIRADIFNVFDFTGVADYDEFGDASAGTASRNYKNILSYQTPRNIRVGLSYKF